MELIFVPAGNGIYVYWTQRPCVRLYYIVTRIHTFVWKWNRIMSFKYNILETQGCVTVELTPNYIIKEIKEIK